MRLWIRYVIPFVLALGSIANVLIPLVDQLTLKWFMRDLDIRTLLIANTLQEPL